MQHGGANKEVCMCQLVGSKSTLGAMMTKCAKMRCKGPGPHHTRICCVCAVTCWLVGPMRKLPTLHCCVVR